MKTYFIDNLHEWLDEILPDLIDELLRVSVLDTGFIYAPYIPLSVTPPMIDPGTFTVPVGKSIRSRPILYNPSRYGTIPIGEVGEPADMSNYQDPPRKVIKRDAITKAIDNFIKKRPSEAPSSFTSVPENFQKILVDRSLRSLTDAGILNYDKEQKGWWRPEVLDALAALPDESTVVGEPPTLSPSQSETLSP
jgi:hypothetical protein